MPEATCIYCLETKNENLFNREHVIPEAFGKFANNLTLIREVCQGCNSYFSKYLELFLGRDSGEALLRYRYKLKPLPEVSRLHKKRIVFTIDVPGDYCGAKVELGVNKTETELQAQLVPQVGFSRLNSTDWRYLDEKELSEFESVRDSLDTRNIRIFANTQDEYEGLLSRLRALGIPFHEKGKLDPPILLNGKLPVKVEYQIDSVILRGIAKIAFNYMARVAGLSFALHSDFNAIRAFIRHGTEGARGFVTPTPGRILWDEPHGMRQTVGHLITLDWDPTKFHIVSQVSLFNEITYVGVLARYFSGLYREIRSGHHFDVKNKEVSALFSCESRLVPFLRGVPRRR